MPVKFLGLQFWAITHFHGPVFLLRHLSRTSIILPSILSTVWPLLTSFFNSISFSWLFSCLSSISLIKIPLDFLLPWACWALPFFFFWYEVILLSYLLPIPCSPLPIFLPLSLPPSSLPFPLPLSTSLWICISKCPFIPLQELLGRDSVHSKLSFTTVACGFLVLRECSSVVNAGFTVLFY